MGELLGAAALGRQDLLRWTGAVIPSLPLSQRQAGN